MASQRRRGAVRLPPPAGPAHRLPRAAAGWALDSGAAFSELSLFGEWRTTPRQYVAAVRRYDDEIGKLEWAPNPRTGCVSPTYWPAPG
jgi:hypothetical protein